VAIVLSLLTHTPPVVGDNVAVFPTHTDAGAVTIGNAYTVAGEVVLLQFVVPSVKVNVTLPADTPVITPALVTVAIVLSLLTQVPPVVGDNVAVFPTHTDTGGITTGNAYTICDNAPVLVRYVTSPEYTAVIGWLPDRRVAIVKVAVPPVSVTGAPSDVPLSKNSTVPVAAA